jgi:hypothetical protein
MTDEQMEKMADVTTGNKILNFSGNQKPKS